jgi:cell division protein FtsA
LARNDILVGLDVGTTKICAVVGRTLDGALQILGVGLAPCRGLRRGVVVDLAETVRAIQDAIARAQRMAGVELESAWVGLTGEHISCQNTRGVITISRADHQVTAEDVHRVRRAADQGVALPADREIIHNISRGYVIDGQPGVRNPVGMSATRLEVEAHVVIGSSNFIQNVEKCVTQAGLDVEAVVLEPIATADAVVTPAERELGVIVLDMGGGTSDLAIFHGGSICYTGAVPAAGELVTKDIAIGLRLTPEDAEQVKITHGVALASLVGEEEIIPVPTIGGGPARELPRALLAEIIEPRMREIFTLVAEKIRESGFGPVVAAGAVLTGGASQLPGTAELASEILQRPVRIGVPAKITGLVETVCNPIYATGVGLVVYAARERAALAAEARPPMAASVWGRLRRWIQELLD